ncbi:MAG: DNA mismatch repair protein MutS [Firmicutes bacterium]|nr:DNA mismatch repair protein MutS [Bacillota bacterium]
MSKMEMMEQYQRIKAEHKDALLFFRLGDFYEMFDGDAAVASRELDLTLTGRWAGETRVPMCGVPFHTADSYIARLVSKGYKVAICEQVEKPQKGKKLLERQIVRIVTPGTVTEDSILEREKNNFLCCVFCGDFKDGEVISAAWADISTGELGFCACESLVKLNELLSRLEPKEIICNAAMQLKSVNLSTVKYGAVCPFSIFDETAFEFSASRDGIIAQLGGEFLGTLRGEESCIIAVGALLKYLNYTQKHRLEHLAPHDGNGEYMLMDYNARRNLELFASLGDGKKHGSLLWVLDKTKTAMGARTLRDWLQRPLLDENLINQRLDAVGELMDGKDFTAEKLADILSEIRDVERIAGRLSCGGISPKDCFSLGISLDGVTKLKSLLDVLNDSTEGKNRENTNAQNALNSGSKVTPNGLTAPIFKNLAAQLSDFSDISNLIKDAIRPDASNFVRDGGVINRGFDEELNRYIELTENSEKFIRRMEAAEKNATGIKNLRISNNKIVGYFIEVTKSNLSQVPYRYQRKGSLLNSERFITEELKEIEREILSAQENAIRREIEIFESLLFAIKQVLGRIFAAAKAVASIDCLLSFAEASKENGYTRPAIAAKFNHIKIKEGRHAVVEKLLKESFVPNDTFINDGADKIMVITGPNMAGKSVYMRQVALITIMAQAGCFVPALSAEICVTDRIFTRVGAGDDIRTGRSTFMVEMSEVSSIIQNAGGRSLVLLDEVGRGTATYDGLSIAWAIIELLAEKFKSKVLFSTHYHELTELEGVIDGVKNYKLTARETDGNIVFVRKLLRGSANKSFGIEVAGLAGLPAAVIMRAKELLNKLEKIDLAKQTKIDLAKVAGEQMSLFATDAQNEIVSILSELDLDSVSPRHALDILCDLKEKIKV